jgi:hypothetical protein
MSALPVNPATLTMFTWVLPLLVIPVMLRMINMLEDMVPPAKAAIPLPGGYRHPLTIIFPVSRSQVLMLAWHVVPAIQVVSIMALLRAVLPVILIPPTMLVYSVAWVATSVTIPVLGHLPASPFRIREVAMVLVSRMKEQLVVTAIPPPSDLRPA